jgi:hypothetical protein
MIFQRSRINQRETVVFNNELNLYAAAVQIVKQNVVMFKVLFLLRHCLA